MSAALREILAIFGTEVDDTGLKKGEKSVESFKDTLKGMGEALVGAFAIHKVVAFTEEVLQSADALAKQAVSLNVAASDLQGWQWAAKLSGSSAEEFTGAFTKFNRNVAEASKGTGPAADAFKALGVSIKDSTGKVGDPIELLDGVADGLVGIEDPAKRVQIIMALLGKSGAKLLPTFLEGSEGLKKLRAEVGELGAGFDEDFLEQAQEVNDNLDRLKLGARGLGIQLVSLVLPALSEWSQGGVKVIKSLIDLIKHSEALKAGLVTFGAVGAAKAISAMVSLAQKAGFLKAGLRGVLLQLAPLVLGFLAIEDVWTFLTGGESVTGDLIEKLFGKDAPGKVREFAKTLKESGLADAAALLKEAFAIFTDGKPLDTKFKEFAAYIETSFRPQLVKDFGAVGDTLATWIQFIGTIVEGLTDLIKLMNWVGKNSVKAAGAAAFAAGDASADADARAARDRAEGKPPSWYNRLRDTLVPSAAIVGGTLGEKPALAAGQDPATRPLSADEIRVAFTNVAASAAPIAFASAPVLGVAGTTEISQSVKTNVVQNFYTDKPEDVQKAASEGAEKGVKKSSDLLAAQAAISKKGG